MSFDLADYRERAERFTEELDREYYVHLAGHKDELEIEPIYGRHGRLFERSAVAALRELAAGASEPEEARRLRYLLGFAFDGHLGLETKREAEEIAGLEATLEVDAPGGAVGYRRVPIEQANEPDAGRRAELEAARDAVLVDRLNPLHRAALERSHELCRELGWPSYADAYGDLRGIDLRALARQARAFLESTDGVFAELVDPRLESEGLSRLGELRRSELPRFFRATELDRGFPPERLVGSLRQTLAGLGIDLDGQANVHLDTEPRPTKSPRAFCSPVRVPGEVYLVVAPVGGRDDFAALLHEGGHTEHYAHADPTLPFEFRHLGDNSVTESFAFLIEHLVEDASWLEATLAIDDAGDALAHAAATKLMLLRRYAAKISYELELHGVEPDLATMPGRYAELLGSATRVRWPEAAWVSDVDGGFYVACYLRAWALETYWRRALRERHSERWFGSPAAGGWLRELWSQGQRLDAVELLDHALGEHLDFSVIAGEFAGAPARG